MYQHIQPQSLLLFDGKFDLLLHTDCIVSSIQLPLPERQPRLADLLRLREGTDGSGRVQRQVQRLALQRCPLWIGTLALAQARIDGGNGILYLGVMHPR